ncbi:MAG: NAD(P)-dependent oxidoreductase, partial [Mycolicibacterium sp.]|nr:NAD(P)-dependent oxidoreductase [Mycolicibacterium sp.]
MKVLLTGALGNIGLCTLKALLEEGHDAVAFDLESRRARKLASGFNGQVHFVWGDITRPDSLQSALEGVDAVIHLAAIIPPYSDRAPDLARRVNLDATHSLIEQMEASSTAKRLVFTSSVGIFGDIQDREPPLRVHTPVCPTDEYGRQKVACEQAIRQCRLQWSILRLAAVTPIHLQAQDPSIMFEFSPDARFEFLHPADTGTAVARAVACTESIGKTLYIAGGAKCRMTYYEFTNALMSAIGIGPIPIDAFVRSTPPRFFGDWVDTEESQRLLQYQRRGLNEQLEDMKND